MSRLIDAESLARAICTVCKDKYTTGEWDNLSPEFKRRRVAEATTILNVAYDIMVTSGKMTIVPATPPREPFGNYDAGEVIDMSNIACGLSPFVRRNAES